MAPAGLGALSSRATGVLAGPGAGDAPSRAESTASFASVLRYRTGREKLKPTVSASVTVPSRGQILTTLSCTLLWSALPSHDLLSSSALTSNATIGAL